MNYYPSKNHKENYKIKELLRKKIMACIWLKTYLPPAPIRASTLLVGPTLSSFECTYFMDDPLENDTDTIVEYWVDLYQYVVNQT